MADDDQWTLSTSIESVMIGLGIGGFIVLLFMAIYLVAKSIKQRRGSGAKTRADDETNLLQNPRNTLPAFANIPATPTVTTMPGHAISDMDRDIKFQIANCQQLQRP
ncbi:hypothetical protein N7517_001003 [Penicillium concentricum]|uniref:Uncharacterized protein n=1 Tax=Penicillium concentricum TaxID=293559 RepID=A0A9W9SR27_9EURO|nr:uncharacterized protein N7517_001003 [Penicillium concentricum]KAJ5383092.1 hypothetical protein N7517_001003 [Penicillium concentricum]